jgi:hypothetical protein
MSEILGSDGMSGELGAVIRAVAAEESAAAATEFPFSREVLHGFVGGVRRRRAGRAAAFAVVALPILGGAAFGLGHLFQGGTVEPGVTPSVTLSPTPEASPTPGPSTSPSPSPSPTTATTTTEPAGDVPGALSGVSAHPGGGSGEINVNWDATTNATGYRVYRAATADGPFDRAAGYTVATGATKIYYGGSYEYIHIWMYSRGLEYTEASIGPGCFRVAAFNDAGTGPKSGVVCAEPLGWSYDPPEDHGPASAPGPPLPSGSP